jgi:hypothetical protein
MRKRGQAPFSRILDGTVPVKYPFRDEEPVEKVVKWPFPKGKPPSQKEIRAGRIISSGRLL